MHSFVLRNTKYVVKYSCKHFVLFAYKMYCTVRTKYLYNNKTVRIGNKLNYNVQSKQGPHVIPQTLYDDRRRRALFLDNGHSLRVIGTRPSLFRRRNLRRFISAIYLYFAPHRHRGEYSHPLDPRRLERQHSVRRL